MSTIYLIRHGQASFGADNYDELSPLGIEQSRVLGEAMARRLPDHGRLRVFSGSMRRQRDTASHCMERMSHSTAPQVDAGVNEVDHEAVLDAQAPHWRDRRAMRAELSVAPDPHRAFQAVFEAAFVRWTSGAHDADYREPWPAFRTRCEAALAQTVQRLAPQETALVFTSGGTIAALCMQLMDLPLDTAMRLNWRLANTGITKLAITRERIQVTSVNEHGHLEGVKGLLSFR